MPPDLASRIAEHLALVSLAMAIGLLLAIPLGVLKALAGSLDAATMRELNRQVDLEHRQPAEVVRTYLRRAAPEAPLHPAPPPPAPGPW